ncbi:MAG TPA: choice-of-anchor Q domain-containing protein [Planctomycetota bacterium]|nr:choice-of-anchor Q domain-containing protein [Planctomycetota bacterium]
MIVRTPVRLIVLGAVTAALGCAGATPSTTSSAQGSAAQTPTGGGGGTAPATSGSSGGTMPAAPPQQPGVKGAPRIFYSDLVSGPNTGGENGDGVFVTVYGNFFGAVQGSSTVTVGGGAVASYPIWSDTKIAFQLGAAARSGTIVVHTGTGDSNGVPFTVRAGNIYFVATTGSDSAAGSFAAPWGTLSHAVDTVQAGDTVYGMDGVVQSVEHNYTACLSIGTAGTAAMPIALVAYPGATVKVGSPTLMGIRVPNVNVTGSYWVIAGLTITGQNEAISLGGNGAVGWRIVANDCSCPGGTGLTGAVETSGATYVSFFGNDVHGCGAGDTKYYHAVYFSTDSNHIECAWNHIHDNQANRSIQFHSSPLGGATGFNQYDLSVHDNVISGGLGDGINFATVDPSQGKVEAYDNVIYRVGLGAPAASQIFSLSAIYVAGITNNGSDGTGTVEVYDNTIYDVGSGLDPSGNVGSGGAFSRAAGASPGLSMRVRDNIVFCLANENYIVPGSDTTLITGSNNVLFGAGAAPAFLTSSVGSDPLFISAATFDFHLQAGSPAIAAGVATGIVTDLDGAPRPGGTRWDVGAYEGP